MSNYHPETALPRLYKLNRYDTVCFVSFILGFIWDLNRNEDAPGLETVSSATRIGIISSVLSIFVPALIPFPLSATVPVIISLVCFSYKYKVSNQMIASISALVFISLALITLELIR